MKLLLRGTLALLLGTGLLSEARADELAQSLARDNSKMAAETSGVIDTQVKELRLLHDSDKLDQDRREVEGSNFKTLVTQQLDLIMTIVGRIEAKANTTSEQQTAGFAALEAKADATSAQLAAISAGVNEVAARAATDRALVFDDRVGLFLEGKVPPTPAEQLTGNLVKAGMESLTGTVSSMASEGYETSNLIRGLETARADLANKAFGPATQVVQGVAAEVASGYLTGRQKFNALFARDTLAVGVDLTTAALSAARCIDPAALATPESFAALPAIKNATAHDFGIIADPTQPIFRVEVTPKDTTRGTYLAAALVNFWDADGSPQVAWAMCEAIDPGKPVEAIDPNAVIAYGDSTAAKSSTATPATRLYSPPTTATCEPAPSACPGGSVLASPNNLSKAAAGAAVGSQSASPIVSTRLF